MRTAHNYFVGALASSDLFLCVFSMPITLWELLFEQWPFGANTVLLCRFANHFMLVWKWQARLKAQYQTFQTFRLFASGKVLPLFMSSMAIVAVGWDRYRCIIQNERYEKLLNTIFSINTFSIIFQLRRSAEFS
jgi:hypothetical protein